MMLHALHPIRKEEQIQYTAPWAEYLDISWNFDHFLDVFQRDVETAEGAWDCPAPLYIEFNISI